MVSSAATSVEQYLNELPENRRTVITAVLELVRRHLPEGYEEGMQYGMISWYIPLSRYPDTYNGKPLAYISLAAQKHHNSLYLMSAYQGSPPEQALRKGFLNAGKKLDMGKCCLRFRSLDALAQEAVGMAIAALTPEAFIEQYEASRSE